MTTRVVVLEPLAFLREGICAVLERDGRVSVVGAAGDLASAERLCRDLKPDVAVVDAKLLARADIDAGSPFARASGLRWVAIGDEPADVLGALRAGAKGCLARTGATEQLVTAVMETRAGHVFLGPEAAEIVVTTLREGPPGHALSPRELEVLGLMVEGLQSKVMASRLGVSIRTIGSHRRALSLKTGLHSVAELTRFALAHGLAGPPRT